MRGSLPHGRRGVQLRPFDRGALTDRRATGTVVDDDTYPPAGWKPTREVRPGPASPPPLPPREASSADDELRGSYTRRARCRPHPCPVRVAPSFLSVRSSASGKTSGGGGAAASAAVASACRSTHDVDAPKLREDAPLSGPARPGRARCRRRPPISRSRGRLPLPASPRRGWCRAVWEESSLRRPVPAAVVVQRRLRLKRVEAPRREDFLVGLSRIGRGSRNRGRAISCGGSKENTTIHRVCTAFDGALGGRTSGPRHRRRRRRAATASLRRGARACSATAPARRQGD